METYVRVVADPVHDVHAVEVGLGPRGMRHVDHGAAATSLAQPRPERPVWVAPGGAAHVVRAGHELPEAEARVPTGVDTGHERRPHRPDEQAVRAVDLDTPALLEERPQHRHLPVAREL